MPWAQGGYVGVDVFFVISGFLITGLLLRDADGDARSLHQLRDFYARRARRILPAAATVIVATLAWSVVAQSSFDQARAADGARAAGLFFSNIRQASEGGYFRANARELFQQYWSLSVEEQFYALWPLVFVVVSAAVMVRFRRHALIAVAAVATVGSFALSLKWSYHRGWLTTQPVRAYFLLPSRAWELGIGVLLAFAAPILSRVDRRAKSALFLAGLAAIVIAVVALSEEARFPGWVALLPTLGTAAVLAAGTGVELPARLSWVLENRGAQLLGRYSYALYLWHWPVVIFLGPELRPRVAWPLAFAAVFAVSLAAAIATYHLVENPIRAGERFRTRSSLSLGVGVASVALCVVAAGLVNARAISSMQGGDLRSAETSGLVPADFVPRGLHPELPRARTATAGNRCGADCATDRDGAATVAFMGDSHLEHLGPGLEAAADQLRVDSRQDWMYACPWFGVIPRATSLGECGDFRDATFAAYAADPPDLIVFSGRNDAVRAVDPTAWEAGIRRTIQALPDASRVAVFGETPTSKQNVPRCLSEHLHDTRACEPTWPDELNAHLKAIVESEGASFVDLRPAFCTVDRCAAIDERTLVWADEDHVTADYARSLGPWFVRVLTPLLPE